MPPLIPSVPPFHQAHALHLCILSCSHWLLQDSAHAEDIQLSCTCYHMLRVLEP